MDGILFCGIILFFFYNFVLYLLPTLCAISVVVATAKVRIFKQITTSWLRWLRRLLLLLLPQRYEFSSKSQHTSLSLDSSVGCCCYRKGTNFQANHNTGWTIVSPLVVVVATAKVRIFKQITTKYLKAVVIVRCCCYRKGTNFQANHNFCLAAFKIF